MVKAVERCTGRDLWRIIVQARAGTAERRSVQSAALRASSCAGLMG